MSIKSLAQAFSHTRDTVTDTYSPGPDGSTTTPMNTRQRLLFARGGPAPVQQFTPDQQWWRDNAAGRWQADFDNGAHAPVSAMRIGEDNTTLDVLPLEANGNVYIDLGGRGATDCAAGRP